MTDIDFQDKAELLLRAVEAGCDRINDDLDLDLDNQRVGGMVTIVFGNQSQIVINLQKPLHEVWLAARSGGYHFRWSGEQWKDTKSGREFYASLSADASLQAGQSIEFSP
jgi:CyaY protein